MKHKAAEVMWMACNDKSIIFDVQGKPVPKQSYRHSKRGGYTPQRVKDWQHLVSAIGLDAFNNLGFKTFCSDVQVELSFRLHDLRRRDLDNLSKGVLDALNGIAWVDDTQIVRLVISKVIDRDNPGVMVKIGAME